MGFVIRREYQGIGGDERYVGSKCSFLVGIFDVHWIAMCKNRKNPEASCLTETNYFLQLFGDTFIGGF